MMKQHSAKTILKIKELCLVFRIELQSTPTLRDLFVSIGQDPIGTIFRQPSRLQVANKISFDVHAGERIGILGVNGAGKSSLCRCIAGMYKPTTGSVEVFGETRAVFNTNIGIQPDLTGRENAELLTQFLYPGLSKNDAKELINDAINFSELGRFIDAPFRLYSNGMQTRLSLSLVSARPTDLLILDEVFDGADTFFKEKISLRVQKMIQLSGAALFVSHSPDQVLKVCNRAIVLDQAQIVFDGEPSEALNFYKKMRPAS